MEWVPLVITLVAGLIIGLVLGMLVQGRQSTNTRQAVAEATEELRKWAGERLQQERYFDLQQLYNKKELIDQNLARMNMDLEKVQSLMVELETGRATQYGQIGERLQEVSQKTTDLTSVTVNLNRTLTSAKIRGQWGERMVEDILQLMGFQEGTNYVKQMGLSDGRPDFTFILPKGVTVNMDVKFPWDNYKRFVESEAETDRDGFRKAFLRDVRGRVKEITNRGYINSDTINCVLLFIPNEHIYAFVHDQDSALLEDALKQKVVLCSPITLFAVLSVIRQAVEHFQLEKTADELLQLMGAFYQQWEKYTEQFEKVGSRLNTAQKEFELLVTTRQRALERPLAKIDDLRKRKGLLPAVDVS
ncbi:MAG TPA: DNA recombination protein RmuC [Caldilineaceae bacterium]|nr:DNA recombination protein RmuC [Caldilineaceae bacterium]